MVDQHLLDLAVLVGKDLPLHDRLERPIGLRLKSICTRNMASRPATIRPSTVMVLGKAEPRNSQVARLSNRHSGIRNRSL